MKEAFKDLFEYNFEMNQLLITVFKKNRILEQTKAHELMSHIMNAQHIWNNRILQIPINYGVWEMQEIENFEAINRNNYEKSQEILQELDENSLIFYTNTKGEQFENRLVDILYHVINHSTYHRAQIATQFREIGLEPIATDYIFWKRN